MQSIQGPPLTPLPSKKGRSVALTPDLMDIELTKRLKEKTINDPLYWCIPDRDPRQLAHALFQYPAMMVPEVQRRLIEVICAVNPKIKSLYDPYVGSGTSLVAGMRNGLNCIGQDINPLAVLLSRVKTQPYKYKNLKSIIKTVIKAAKNDELNIVAVNFPGIDKWFRNDVQQDLSRLRRSIQKQPKDIRPFLWVILAETIRLTSNDRTSTYKLHARPKEESNNRDLDPINTFELLAIRGYEDLKIFHLDLANARLMVKRNLYKGQSVIEIEDTQEKAITVPDVNQKYDLLITSPPYGDNTTTVPYGQHSYLALNWIDLSDIDEKVDPTILRTTQEIDRRSLGGILEREQLQEVIVNISKKTVTLGKIINSFPEDSAKDSITRVVTFFNDLDICLKNIISVMNPNAYLCWTVANRRISNIEIPIDQILTELFSSYNVKYITCINRTIHHKRMPSRNKTADTMKQERIIIFRT